MILDGKCLHSAARANNCKYCPDCGEKIIHKWFVIKCNKCGHYRKPVMDIFGKIKPAKKYCFNCGSDHWNYQNYLESNIPDRMKLIAVKQVFTEEGVAIPENKKTRVWISRA